MRRFILAVLIVVSLTSCSDNFIQPDYPLCYNGDVQVVYNDIEFESYFVCTQDEMSFSLSRPETLKGLVITKQGEKTLISKDSLELTYDNNTLDNLCPFIYLFDVFRMLNSEKCLFNDAGSFKISEFQINGKNCKVTLEKENNSFVQIDYDRYIFKFKA